MTLLLVKAAVIVALTHGLRAVASAAGPRWGGLVLGLPASSAVALFFVGRDRGPEFAAASATAGLFGLVAASCLAVGAGRLLAAGRRVVVALPAGVGCFAAVAVAGRWVGPTELPAAVAVSLVALAGCAVAAGRLVRPPAATPRPVGRRVRNLVLRTVVPLAILLPVIEVAGAVGPTWAGLLGTFPCTLAAVLVVTALEAGTATAAAVARSFPAGNFSMVGFVAVFGMTCRPAGLPAALAAGYAAALLVLAGMELVRRSRAEARCPGPGRRV